MARRRYTDGAVARTILGNRVQPGMYTSSRPRSGPADEVGHLPAVPSQCPLEPMSFRLSGGAAGGLSSANAGSRAE